MLERGWTIGKIAVDRISKAQHAHDSESRHPNRFIGVAVPDVPMVGTVEAPLNTCVNDGHGLGDYLHT